MNKKISILLVVILCWSFSYSFSWAVGPEVSGKAAVLLESRTGKVFYQKEPHKRMKIASITKIMTAIIAIENRELNEFVPVSKRAVGVEGSSIYLKFGEKISLRSLLYGLMLRSGNDAAVAIAEYVGGSVEGFVYLMNQKAAHLGMSNTHFANPHGLDASDHYSSAYDMAKLTAYAMKNPAFRQAVKTKVARVDWPNQQWKQVFYNKNKFLSLYPLATGVKTGYTKEAGRTLVTTASKGNHHLVAVTINAPNDWTDHQRLFEYGFQQLSLQRTLPRGKKVLTTSVFNRQKQQLMIVTDQSFSYPFTQLEQEQIRLKPIIAYPIQTVRRSGQVVGQLKVYLHDQYLGSVPLSSMWSERPGFIHRWREVLFSILTSGGRELE